MNNGVPRVPLGELLTKSENWVDIRPDQRYRQVTVRLWGKGVILRGEASGAEIAASRQLMVKPLQFILSRIDARNGAFGLIPDELDGAVVSSDFPVFILDNSRVLPQFLDWMSKTSDFVDLCKAASEGTTNRVRLKEDRFLTAEIPLPPLEEQHRLVARIEELAARIEEARGLRREVVEETTDALIQAAQRRLIGEVPTAGWLPLSAYVREIENGWSPACENHPATNNEWGVLKVGAVSFGVYQEFENKALPSTLEPRPEYEVHAGDFLMSRANTTNLVGACTLVRRTRPKLM